jgi:hypothetical protein
LEDNDGNRRQVAKKAKMCSEVCSNRVSRRQPLRIQYELGSRSPAASDFGGSAAWPDARREEGASPASGLSAGHLVKAAIPQVCSGNDVESSFGKPHRIRSGKFRDLNELTSGKPRFPSTVTMQRSTNAS